MRRLLNILEDPRVERWMRRRFPGAAPWIEATRSSLPPQSAPVDLTINLVLREFLWEGQQLDATGQVAGTFQPDDEVRLDAMGELVAATVRATRAARASYLFDFLPENPHEVRPEVFGRYAALGMPPVAPAEAQWRVLAWDATELVRRSVWPAIEALWALDVRRMGRILREDGGLRQRVSAALASGRDLRHLARFAARRTQATRRNEPAIDANDLPLATALAESLFEQPNDRTVPQTGPSSGKPSQGALAVTPEDVVVDLVTRLEATLPGRTHARDAGRFRTGSRLDLRRALAFEATGRDVRIFERDVAEKRRDAAAVLCVDLSCSMQGRRVEGAIAGTRVFAAVLSRLKIPFCVLGYQDVPFVIIDFEESADWSTDPALDARIDALRDEPSGVQFDAGAGPASQRHPGSTEMVPALDEAAARLRAKGAADSILLMLTDGEANGRFSAPEVLQDRVAHHSKHHALVAAGIGPETAAVVKCFPRSAANIQPEQLHVALGSLLEDAILATL